MKRFFTAFVSLIILFSFSACNNDTTTQYEGEKLAYTEMTNSDGSIAKRWYYKYYPDGEISTSTRCSEDGTCIQRNEYTYTPENLKETEIIYIYGKKASVTEFSYNDDGKLKSEKNYLPDSITETSYYYNPDGTIDYTQSVNASGEIVSTKRCIYDESGNMIKERFFDANDYQTGGIEYTYEGKKLIMKEYIRGALDEFSREEYTYDGENVVKTLLYDRTGNLIYTDTAEYEGDICMHRMRVDSNNAIVYTWDAYYDSFLTLIG